MKNKKIVFFCVLSVVVIGVIALCIGLFKENRPKTIYSKTYSPYTTETTTLTLFEDEFEYEKTITTPEGQIVYHNFESGDYLLTNDLFVFSVNHSTEKHYYPTGQLIDSTNKSAYTLYGKKISDTYVTYGYFLLPLKDVATKQAGIASLCQIKYQSQYDMVIPVNVENLNLYASRFLMYVDENGSQEHTSFELDVDTSKTGVTTATVRWNGLEKEITVLITDQHHPAFDDNLNVRPR